VEDAESAGELVRDAAFPFRLMPNIRENVDENTKQTIGY